MPIGQSKMSTLANSKAIRMLRDLPEEDRPEFRDFAASPIFNRDSVLRTLVELLLEALPSLPTETELRQALYPEEAALSARRLDPLKTKLVRLIRDYVDFRARRRPGDVLAHGIARLEEWRERADEKQLRREAEEIAAELEGTGPLSVDRHHQDYRRWTFAAEHHSVFGGETGQDLANAYRAATNHATAVQLRLLCAMVNRYRILRPSEIPEWVREEAARLRRESPESPPLVQLYRRCLELQLNPASRVAYARFSDLLLAESSRLSRKEGHDLYQYLINYHIRRFNQDQKERSAAEAITFLYQQLLDTGLLLENGHLSPWNYKNIVTLVSRIGQLDWLEEFMAQYETRLWRDYGGNSANFCRGLYAFYRRDFREAIRRMETVLTDFRDVFWGLEARALLLRALYESDRHDELNTAYHSARMYVGRKGGKNVSTAHKTSYGNFYLALYRLSKLVTVPREKRTAKLKKLEEEIRQTDHLPNSSWLLAKIAEANG